MPGAGWTKDASPEEFLRVTGILAARKAALLRAGAILQSEWVEILGSPGTGKLYEEGFAFITTKGAPRRVIRIRGSAKFPGRSAPHRASAPSLPPAPDRGTRGGLRGSVLIDDSSPERVRVGFNAAQNGRIALALEYGVNVAGSRVGRHPAENFRIAPRPHARPAGDRARPLMTAAIVRVFREQVPDVRVTEGS
jgi:hypothetical protein